MGELRLNILGPFEILRDGQPVVLKSRKQRWLLLDLILSAGEVVSRDRLIEDLWSDDAPASVDVTLSSYVSTVRSSLEPQRERGSRGTVLITRDPGYMLDTANVMIDAHEFERLVGEAGQANGQARSELLDQALAMVRGAPLSDVQYEEFAVTEVRRLSELILSTREQAIDLSLDRGEHRSLAGELEQLVRDHPLREGLRGQLMLALYRNGRQADALRVFTEGREKLVDELGIDPGPALVDLESRILAQDSALLELSGAAPAEPVAESETRVQGDTAAPSAMAPSSPAEPLLGREAQTVLARELLADLRQGQSSTLLVRGAAGVGKSRLARQILDIASATGEIAICLGSCLEGAPPLNAWARAMSSYAAHQGIGVFDHLTKPVLRDMFRLFPDGAGQVGLARPELVTDEQEALGLLDNITTAALTVSRHTPLVCVIEDLHWASAGTMQVFTRVAESAPDGAFLLIGTYRDDALHLTPMLRQETARIAGKPRVTSMPLSGLDIEAGHELIEQILGTDVSRSAATALVERTQGNPLYLTELARSATSASSAFDPSVPVGREVIDAIRQRIGLLPEDVVELLHVCSFSSGSLHPAVDSMVLETDQDEIERRYDIAIEAGVLEDDPAVDGNLRFTQELVREALYEAVPSRRRARIHAKLGAALESRDDNHNDVAAAAVARHYVLGVSAGTRASAIEWSIRAAERASALFDHNEAFTHWKTVLDLVERDPTGDRTQRCRALLGIGVAGRGSQHVDEAIAAFLEAFSMARDDADVVLMAEAALNYSEGIGTSEARAWWRPGRTALDALDEALRAIDATSELSSSELTVRLLARRAGDGIDLGADVRKELIERAATLADHLDSPADRCHVHAAAIVALWDVLEVPELLARCDVGIELATEIAQRPLELQLRRWSVAFTLMSGELHDAERRTNEANRRAALFGPAYSGFAPKTLRPMLDFICGRYAEAEAAHQAFLDEPSNIGFLSDSHLIALANLEWHRGNIAGWIDSIADHGASSRQPAVVAMLALIHANNGELERAEQVVRSLRSTEIAQFGGASDNGLLPWALAQVAAALEDRVLAESMYNRLCYIEHKLVLPGPAMIPIGLVDQALGRAAVAIGDLDAAQQHVESAYSLLDALHAVPWRFQTDLVAADLHIALGEPAKARVLLDRTVELAIRSGTKLAAEMAERALADLA